MRTIMIGLLAILGMGTAVSAQTVASPAESCLAATPSPALGVRLVRTAARLKAGAPLRIVAIGSSSTAGLWSGGRGFPEIMATELQSLRANAEISVVNSGQLGDTINGALRRMERDVFSHQPDLVIWQLGTNDIVWGGKASGHVQSAIIKGIADIRARGADIVLMDLQYAPMVRNSGETSAMQSIIRATSQSQKVGLFSRYALFANAEKAGLSPSALNSIDGLHHSRAGYECIGRALARAIHAASR